jgi:flagellar protein FliS
MTMTNPRAYGAAHCYSQVGSEAAVTDADPHHLIKLLLDGALSRIAAAKGHMQRGEVGPKGECIGKAIAIVDGLRAALDHAKGGEIARNLGDLYDYMEHGLLEANLRNDLARLDEVARLLGEIRDAWAAIGQQGAVTP